MKVKILSHTPEPEKVISMAAKLCYSAVGVDQIEENLTPEQRKGFPRIFFLDNIDPDTINGLLNILDYFMGFFRFLYF